MNKTIRTIIVDATSRAAAPLCLLAALLGGCASTNVERTKASGSDVSAQTLYQRGIEAQRQGDATRAEQYLAAALEQGYPAREAFPALLSVCIAADRNDTALYYARARLLHDPQDWPLRYLVASLHLAVGQDDRARLEVDRLIDEQPNRPEPHYLLGVIERDRGGDRRSAARAFKRYLVLAPKGPHADEARNYLRRSGS